MTTKCVRELPDGYTFKFPGTGQTVDELTAFIKNERECCPFFTFNLSVSGDKGGARLELTGPEGLDYVILYMSVKENLKEGVI